MEYMPERNKDMNNGDLIPQEENFSDEKIMHVVGKILDAITIDKSVNALIVSAEGDTSNGLRIGKGFAEGIQKRGGNATLVTFEPCAWEEPREERLTDLLLDPKFNLLIASDIDSMGHDAQGETVPYRIADRKFTEAIFFRKAQGNARTFWFVADDMKRFLESTDIDYQELGTISLQLERELQKASRIKFITDDGKAVLEFETRADVEPMGDYDFGQGRLGTGGNIPMGEVFITPNNQTGKGSIVIDESFCGDDTVLCRQPVILRFEDGHVTEIEGGDEARILHEFLLSQGEKTQEAMRTRPDVTPEYLSNIYRIGEFAIGVSRGATFGGHLLYGEKVYASAHIAIGSSYHGDPAFSHVDLVVKEPKIVLVYPDGSEKTIVEQGKILLDNISAY